MKIVLFILATILILGCGNKKMQKYEPQKNVTAEDVRQLREELKI